VSRVGGISAERLKSFIERIEKLEEERKAIGGDIRDVYAEAKGGGFDVKTMRKVVALRKMDAADRDEQEAILDVYKRALGMEPGDELGPAPVDPAVQRAADLFNADRTVREVALAMSVSTGKAGQLRQEAEMLGLLDSDDGNGEVLSTSISNGQAPAPALTDRERANLEAFRAGGSVPPAPKPAPRKPRAPKAAPAASPSGADASARKDEVLDTADDTRPAEAAFSAPDTASPPAPEGAAGGDDGRGSGEPAAANAIDPGGEAATAAGTLSITAAGDVFDTQTGEIITDARGQFPDAERVPERVPAGVGDDPSDDDWNPWGDDDQGRAEVSAPQPEHADQLAEGPKPLTHGQDAVTRIQDSARDGTQGSTPAAATSLDDGMTIPRFLKRGTDENAAAMRGGR
jgi:uncharacterized protein (UPF0335 family)